MRIGFDAKRFFNNKTGLGSFSRNLINALIRDFPDHDYFLYTTKEPSIEYIDQFLDMSNVKIRYPKKTQRNYWRTRGILYDLVNDEIDIYHGLSNELPFGIHKTDIKSIVTIHDVLFKQFPQDYRLIDRMIYDWKSKYACQNADRVVAISEATRTVINSQYNTQSDKLSVIRQDIDSSFAEELKGIVQTQVLQDLQLNAGYLLFVGNDSRRKNLMTVLRSLKYLKEQATLVLLLNSKNLNKECSEFILNEKLSNQIKSYSNITQEQLRVLYRNAKCLIYPSLGEGWGLPVDEALASGTKVLVPNYLPFTEIQNERKIFLKDPKDPVEIAQIVESIRSFRADSVHEYIVSPVEKYFEVYRDLFKGD